MVTFKLGDGPSAVHVPLPPRDYIARRLNGECTLVLTDSAVGQARIIGMNILSKMITVFDRRNDRLGFCITRSKNRILPNTATHYVLLKGTVREAHKFFPLLACVLR